MKRVIALTLTIVLLLSCFPNLAFAVDKQSGGLIRVKDASAMAGQSVCVEIEIENNPGIQGATLVLTWDAGLKLESAENGEAFEALSLTLPGNLVSGKNFVWYRQATVSDSDIVDGTILTLNFRISEDATDGDAYNVCASYTNGDIFDKNLQIVQPAIENAVVSVVSYSPGDVDGSERINAMDLVLLSRYIADGCMTDPEGYNVSLNPNAGDVNGDGRLNALDLVLISRYIADGCVTDPEGYNVTLKPSSHDFRHTHTMQETLFKAATCTEDGNVAYWYCTGCDKYFSDAAGTAVISLEDTVIAAGGHTVVIDSAVPATNKSTGLTEGSHCSVCGEVLVKQETYGPLASDTANITYKMSYIETTTSEKTKAIVLDKYIEEQVEKQVIQNDNNPKTYTVGEGVAELTEPTLSGYDFLGWYDAPDINAKRVYNISTEATGDITLYGVWSEHRYDIIYKLYQTPLEDTIDTKFCGYTSSKGLANLPNPELYKYVFLGWYTNEGEEVTEIPVGTSGDLVLNAYWTSERNLAKANKTQGDPFVFEDTDNGVIYFAYELGTIENIPLSDNIWTIQSVYGLEQQKSETYTTSLNQTRADAVSNTISNSTVDSNTWTLSEGWNDSTSVTEEWAEEHGMTVEEANERCKSTTGTYSVTDSNGGSKSKTKTDGTTVISFNSKNEIDSESAELCSKNTTSDSSSEEVDANFGASFKLFKAEVDTKNSSTHEISREETTGLKEQKESNTHTGTDITTISTTVNANTSTWNTASTRSNTEQASERNSVNQAIADVIASKTGYGSSYTANGENSKTQGFSKSSSDSVNSSSSLTWSSVESKTVTDTYFVNGKKDGCYRLVIAGTAHVFGVVGYDVGTNSFFTYSYSVMDDKQYEFLDYSPDLNFDDCENSVLPFEIPYDIFEYAANATVRTKGLEFITDSSTKTARLIEYTGDSVDVAVPDYIASGGVAYKVTALAPSAFAGKNVRAVKLSKYIEELPAGAFKNCANLEQVSGYYSVIGDEALSGCTSLENYNITVSMKAIGKDAFLGVPSIVVNAISEEYALEASNGDTAAARSLTQTLIDSALSSGARQIVLSLNDIIDGCELTLEVPSIERFELVGCIDIKKMRAYSDLRLFSSAETTILRNLKITDCTRIPLEIASSALTLEVVDIGGVGSCLLLPNQTTTTLIKDNKLASQNGKAVICTAPTFVSEHSDGIAGYLKVSGNIYAYGTVTGIGSLVFADGDIISIGSKDEFENYKKGAFSVRFNVNGGDELIDAEKTIYFGSEYGSLPTPTREHYNFDGWYTDAMGGTRITAGDTVREADDVVLYAHWSPKTFTVTLNANEGVCDTTSMEGTYGVAVGTLPTPTRDYYTFAGWYTEPNGGDKVTEGTKFTTGEDVTLYAHWTLNGLSDWVTASAVPDGAKIVNTKWTYAQRETTSSSASSLSGWNKYDTQRTSWSAWSSWSTTNPTNGVRNVESRSVYDHTVYHYYRWYNGTYVYSYKYNSGYCLEEKWFDYELPVYLSGNYGTSIRAEQGYADTKNAWKYVWVEAKSDVNYSVDKTWTKDVNRNEWRYQDPVYTYYYERNVQKTTSEQDPTGQTGVSNVVKYVQYRIK